ncbi:MAG: hypothetical protein K2V38_16975, partial [Gemmataceae bacterium]|nr:hypothetical protein [Gemmataceae bacterium]
VETALAGVKEVTHVKVGFLPAPKAQPGVPVGPGGAVRPPVRQFAPELKEGQEMLFFLAKHPSADFYVLPAMSPPVDVSTDAGKKEIDGVKKTLEVLADPMKGLKSDKADVRATTAATLVMKYRSYPDMGGEVDQVAIGADESKLILKAIAEGDWSNQVKPGTPANLNPSVVTAFYQIGLTDKDGWRQPMFPQPQPGQPPVDFNALVKEAFVKWLAGPGKDYQIKKMVPKKPTEK